MGRAERTVLALVGAAICGVGAGLLQVSVDAREPSVVVAALAFWTIGVYVVVGAVRGR